MNILNKLLMAGALVISLASCKEDVDLRPTDQILGDNAFTNVNDLNSGAQGVYGTWQQRRPIYLSAILSDEARQGSGSEYRGVGAILFRWEHTSDAQDFRDAEPGGVWTNMYAVIDRANRVLAGAENVQVQGADAGTRDRIRGEMLALRAFAHFEMLRTYARAYDPAAPGVPYMAEYAQNPSSFRPSRNTSGEVVTRIEADLAEARGLIPANFTNSSRVTRNGVVAMQARVALYTRSWDSAINRATFVINAQPLTSRANYAALWTTRDLPDNQSSEVIWQLNVTASNTGAITGSSDLRVGSLFQDANQAVQFLPSQKLLNSYDSTADIRFPTFYRTSPRIALAKYGVVLPGAPNDFVYDIKVLRTSEMYLIRAEAHAEKGDLASAAADVNALRAQRITGYVPVVYTSKDQAIADILLERYRELAFEGHRYFDLKRRNLPIQRLLSDVQNNTAIATLEPTNPKYLLPIPQQEIFANPNITQNPGY